MGERARSALLVESILAPPLSVSCASKQRSTDHRKGAFTAYMRDGSGRTELQHS